MWSKPSPSCAGTARPLRVAYLLDPANCTDRLLDEIFAEAYGRWGGRRTLIVPATEHGIDQRYQNWLWFYDADVIYSYVALTDEAVAGVHERYGPAHLKQHGGMNRKEEAPGYFKPELPIAGLSCLSVVPSLLSRPWNVLERVTNPQILNKFWDRSESRFLSENFGFLSDCFQPLIISGHPELFTCLTLIGQDSLANQHLGKDPSSEYVTDEKNILDALAQRRPILTLANLSEVLTPYLETTDPAGGWPSGLSLVVGDSIDDRLLFWNAHQHYQSPLFGQITTLHISTEKAADLTFLTQLRSIIKQRGTYNFQGRNDTIILRSCSIEKSCLDEIAKALRGKDVFLRVQVARDQDHAACVPQFAHPDRVRYANSIGFQERDFSETTEIKDQRVYVPAAIPWHVREARPPANLRMGNWIIDLWIDRLEDHCRFANERHTWLLPRRLRMERAFKLERQGDRFQNYELSVIRVLRGGGIAVAYHAEQRAVSITVPTDLDAFRNALCNREEWFPFERYRQNAPHGRQRYRYAELSDKGRYQLGVIERFGSVQEAFDILMNGYWRDVLLQLGATPAEKNESLQKDVVTTLRRRLNQPTGPMNIATPEEEERLAREAIRAGRKIQRENRYIDYGTLFKMWNNIVHEFDKQYPSRDESDEAFYHDTEHLNSSIKRLCHREILYQGREWKCRRCFNRNWVTIDGMRSTLVCEVCRSQEPAPVSGDWHFRPNAFVIEAYRDHGVEAVIYGLFHLWERARNSFYFSPSMLLWGDYPDEPGAKPIEIDALAVVDNKLYLCEAKNYDGLSTQDKAKLLAAVERVRPDVLLLVCMDTDVRRMTAASAELQPKIGTDVRVEVLGFMPERLRRDPILP